MTGDKNTMNDMPSSAPTATWCDSHAGQNSADGGQTSAGLMGNRGEWLALLLNGLPHPVLVKDRSHRWLILNDEMCKLIGRSREDLLGASDFDIFPHEQATGYWATDDEVFATGEDREVEEELTSADGQIHILQTRKRLIVLPRPDGNVPLLIASVTDITKMRRAEAELRESEEHYRYSVELSPQIPWTAEPSGMIIEAGPRWLALTGMGREETLGAGWAKGLHPSDVEDALRKWAHSLQTGNTFDTAYRVRGADGTYRWFRAHAAARRLADGSIVRWYGTLEDINERKLADEALRESELRFRAMADNSPVAIWVTDPSGATVFLNRLWYRMTGQTEAEALGYGWTEAIHPQDREMVEQVFMTANARRDPLRVEYRLRQADGQWAWMIDAGQPRFATNGDFLGYVGSALDITESKQARENAEGAARRLSYVLESTLDSVVVLDSQWRLTYFNENASRTLQPRKLQLGRNLWDIFPTEADGIFARNYRTAMAQQIPLAFEEYLPATDQWLEVHACPAVDGISIFFRDVTERRKAEQERLIAQERIAYLARHDTLTDLPNRLQFRERLERALTSGRTQTKSAVLYLDLDGFKAVNDTLGHPMGDALLQLVAKRLQNCVRGSDIVARFGGDEFAILQTGIARMDDSGQLAQRIIDALAEPFELDTQPIIIGTSIGIAVTPDNGSGIDHLLKSADIALYDAKAEGRGTYRFFQASMDERLQARQALKLAIRAALARGEFELNYQPIVDLGTGRLSCFEALLRWRSPERGIISPADFVPVAEESGLIVALGEWVLATACRTAAEWPSDIAVAVNLSPLQFKSGRLVQIVEEALLASGLNPARLQLEVTESVLLHDSACNLQTLRDLRRLGARIAIDDFGTGYSSLSYLRSFPFDKIKLDRSFVSDLPDGLEARTILRAVAGIGHGLGITMTAEGIETPMQLKAVHGEHYDEGQGYLFSKPVAAADVGHLIARSKVAGLIPAFAQHEPELVSTERPAQPT